MRRAARVGDAWRSSAVVCADGRQARAPRGTRRLAPRTRAARRVPLRPGGSHGVRARSHARPRRRRDRDRGAPLRRRGTDRRPAGGDLPRARGGARAAGVAALHVQLESDALRVVATLSLTLILFTDALSLNLREAREHRRLALLALGPGTLLSAVLYAGLAVWLLDLPLPAAAILGAAVASTDPVPAKASCAGATCQQRRAHLQSGLNDVVLLPVVLVAMVFATGSAQRTDFARWSLDLFLLGPAAGVAVGLVSLATLEMVRRRVGVRRDYESLYSLGVAFAAYAAAESVHGSGFLAAFAAGLTIAAFDVELCECFKEYGETTAELALLHLRPPGQLAHLDRGGRGEPLASLAFAVLVLLGRPLVYYLALAAGRVDPTSRHLVAWFGPRGLSSLLLVLLPVFAGTPGSEELFRVTCLVVLLSVLLHGGALAWLARRGEPRPATTEPGSVLIRADELATLRARARRWSCSAGRGRVGAQDRGPAGGRGAHRARSPARARLGARPSARRLARPLLHLTEREYERPGGAPAPAPRLPAGARPGGLAALQKEAAA